MKLPPPTTRLTFRPMREEDLDFIATMLADPLFMQHYPKTYRREEAAQWIARMIQRYEQDGSALWLIEDRQSRRPIGQVGVLMQRIEDQCETEIGYLIHRPHWRQGFAKEAAAACRDFAFGPLDRLRIIHLIRPQNIPSLCTALSIGSRPEKVTMFYDREHLVLSQERATNRSADALVARAPYR